MWEWRMQTWCFLQRPETRESILPLKQQEEASFDISNFLKTNADTCRQPLSHDVFNCPKRTRRYMFDVTKGRCVRFWGCRKPGNNFDKKRTCKETCITAYKGKSRKSRPRNENCLLPVENVHVVCFGNYVGDGYMTSLKTSAWKSRDVRDPETTSKSDWNANLNACAAGKGRNLDE